MVNLFIQQTTKKNRNKQMKRTCLAVFALLIAGFSLKAQQSTNTTKFRIALNGGYTYRLAKVAD